jgi:hypothetical protein
MTDPTHDALQLQPFQGDSRGGDLVVEDRALRPQVLQIEQGCADLVGADDYDFVALGLAMGNAIYLAVNGSSHREG